MLSRKSIKVLIVLGVALVLVYAWIAPLKLFNTSPVCQGGSKVLIADQLDLSSPNATFTKYVESVFDRAGVKYDLCVGKDITVDFYRALPSMGYRLILLRVHSGLLQPVTPDKPVYLFTGEPFSTKKYADEMLSGALVGCQVTTRDPIYFCIAPGFVSRSMNGTFPGSLMLLSGCSGLINANLAGAFVLRGASGIVSWDEYVTAPHTDEAFSRFIDDFVAKQMSVSQAVNDVMGAVGPDPDYNSKLVYYPDNAATVKLADLLSANWPRTQSTTSPFAQLGMWMGERVQSVLSLSRLELIPVLYLDH